MLFPIKPQATSTHGVFPQIPDPWTLSMVSASRSPTLPRYIPLDPSHELSGVPIPDVLMPEGLPGAFRLAAPAMSVQSAIAILLSDEIKLADQADDALRRDIEDAIAVLELSTAHAGDPFELG